MPLAQATKAAPSRRNGRASRATPRIACAGTTPSTISASFSSRKVGGRRHRARQRQARQMAAVLAVARQRRDMLGVVSPQRDMIAFERRDIGEGHAPGAGPEHHDAGAGHLAPIR